MSYGTLNDSDGSAFKTRDGGTKPLNDLFDETHNYIKKINKSLDESTTSQLTNSVLTFSDLITNRKTDYKFDLEKFTNVNGKTGIYIQYSQVRAKKILSDIENSSNNFQITNLNSDERELCLLISKFTYFFK